MPAIILHYYVSKLQIDAAGQLVDVVAESKVDEFSGHSHSQINNRVYNSNNCGSEDERNIIIITTITIITYLCGGGVATERDGVSSFDCAR